MVIKEDFRQLNEFQKAELGFLFGGNRGRMSQKRKLKMRSSKQAKMKVDGLKDVKVRKRMSVAGIPPGRKASKLHNHNHSHVEHPINGQKDRNITCDLRKIQENYSQG